MSENCFFARFGEAEELGGVITKSMQGCTGLKFHLDALEVGMRERGESYTVRKLKVSED